MNDLETDLRALLAERAGSMRAAAEGHATTLGRAHRRRRLTVGVAALAVVAIVVGSVAFVRPLFDSDPIRPVDSGEGHSTSGPYGFTSTPGTRPVVARGTFRDTSWVLRGERQRMGAGDDAIRLELSIERGGGQPAFETDTVVAASDDVLQVAHDLPDMLDGEAEVVFGATVPGIDSVGIDFRLGLEQSVDPHVFKSYRVPGAVKADYFVAFVPPGEPGWVAARNEIGIDLESERINISGLSVPQIASGRFGRPRTEFQRATGSGLWWMKFSGRKDQLCLLFFSDDTEKECFPRTEIESADLLVGATYVGNGVMGVSAILADRVAQVRLRVDGEAPAALPWVQPPRSDLDTWPLRIAVVGVAPDATGRIEALDDRGRVIGGYQF